MREDSNPGQESASTVRAREPREGWERCTPYGISNELMMEKRSCLSCAPPRGHANRHPQAPRDGGTGQSAGVCLSRSQKLGENPHQPPSDQSRAQPPRLQEERRDLGSRSLPGCAGMHRIPSPLHMHARSNLINKSKNEVLHVAAKHY